MGNECFVLGAGFSHACSLPLARDLTKAVYDFTFGDPQAQSLRDAAERRKREIKFFFDRCDCEKTWPDFEQLLTFVDEYISFADDAAAIGMFANRDEPTHLRDSLVQNLLLVLAAKTSEAPPERMHLVENFTDVVGRSDASVICFNWDCLFEIACRNRNHALTYSDRLGDRIRFVKPHGSLDLVELPDSEWAKIKNEYCGRRLEHLRSFGGKSMLRAKEPENAADHCLYPFAPDYRLVVPPGARKSFESFWLKEQCAYAMNLLRSARRITVIGYSLPEFDFRSRLMFRIARYRTPKNRPLRVRIVDPYPGPLVERLTDLGYNQFQCIAKPWEEWFENEGEAAIRGR